MLIVPLIVLVRLTQYSANPRAGGTTDDRALQSTTEQRTQNRSASTSNQRALARSNPTLVPVSIMVIVSIMVMASVIVRRRDCRRELRRKNRADSALRR